MTLAVTNTKVPLGAVTILRVVDSFLNLKTAVAVWSEARVTRKALSRLSDQQLEDIGLTRADQF